MTALLADIKENNTGYLRINMKKKNQNYNVLSYFNCKWKETG